MLATAATQPFQPWTIFWPAIAGTVVLGSVMIFGLWYERRERLRRFRSPQTEKLLRPAGHSLSLELDRAFEKAVADLWWGLCLCGIGCGFIQPAVWTLFLLRAPPWQGVVSIILVPTLLFAGVYKAFRVIRGAVKARELRLGLRGEQAAAEGLYEAAARSGYWIYHDFPGGENWNIDHIAVGTRGVFAVESKARSKPISTEDPGHPANKVFVEGRVLKFPNNKINSKAIPQAERNADALAQFIKTSAGESVAVEPIVVLPGWLVEGEQASARALVLNPKRIFYYLENRAPRINPDQVQRIRFQIDQKCRDVEFY